MLMIHLPKCTPSALAGHAPRSTAIAQGSPDNLSIFAATNPAM
jgi:hypothetical protein